MPALALRGGRSTLLPATLARQIVTRRPCTRLAELPHAGHWIHDDPDGFTRADAAILNSPSTRPLN